VIDLIIIDLFAMNLTKFDFAVTMIYLYELIEDFVNLSNQSIPVIDNQFNLSQYNNISTTIKTDTGFIPKQTDQDVQQQHLQEQQRLKKEIQQQQELLQKQEQQIKQLLQQNSLNAQALSNNSNNVFKSVEADNNSNNISQAIKVENNANNITKTVKDESNLNNKSQSNTN